MLAEMETALSRSKAEQIKISKKLKEETSNLSAKQAVSVIKDSNKAKEKTIKAAEKQRDAVIDAADEQRYVKGSISQKEHDKTVKTQGVRPKRQLMKQRNSQRCRKGSEEAS
ncbi:hypothetical protein ACO1DC_16085 [Bacillus velezensis]